MLESLESRRLLSVSASLSNGNLQVKASGGDADIAVEETLGSPGSFTVTDNTTNPSTVQSFSGVSSVALWGNTGADRLLFRGYTVGASVRGNNNNDIISVDDAGTGTSTVDGESDDDLIAVIRAHNTTVTGGSGNDFIVINSWNSDPSGEGNVNLDNASAYVVAGSGNDIIKLVDGKATVNGGSGIDELILTAQSDGVTYTNVETVTPA
jgi:Ca2+-binding RTX toxin-like protein